MLNLKGRQFQVHHKFTRDIQTAEKKSKKSNRYVPVKSCEWNKDIWKIGTAWHKPFDNSTTWNRQSALGQSCPGAGWRGCCVIFWKDSITMHYILITHYCKETASKAGCLILNLRTVPHKRASLRNECVVQKALTQMGLQMSLVFRFPPEKCCRPIIGHSERLCFGFLLALH